MTYQIRRVAVLGAGTMGAAIAALVVNAGLDADLLDIAPSDLTPDEERKGLSLQAPAVRNRIVKAGFDRLLKAKPAALMSPQLASRIRLGNFEDDFDRLRQADWIVEAIVERLEPKRALMERVEGVCKDTAIVSSNTSGIPLHSIVEGRSDSFKRRFLGTHFFNPPRYLKLMELIPTPDTDPELVAFMRRFGEGALGKGAVIAKDTPNFIANRLGSYAGMQAMRYAFDHGYGIEEVDAVTGPLIGRPSTATFRLSDQVGLDIMVGVAQNLYDAVPDDESRAELRPPAPLLRMQEAGILGIKTGGGFYKRTTRDGKTVFDVVDMDSFDYHPAQAPTVPIADAARKQGDLAARLRFLVARAGDDKDARYVRDTLLPSLAYAARRVPAIADSLVDIDHAMEWGFGQQAGPFRTWDMLGVRETADLMDRQGIAVAPWVREMLDAGIFSFYTTRDGQAVVYSPVSKTYEPVPVDPEAISLDALRADGKEVARNDSASLLDLGDDVLLLEIHSKASAIDSLLVEMGGRALQELEGGRWAGLVIANQSPNFCVGANLYEVAGGAQQGVFDQIGGAVAALQNLLMGFRFSPKPVVAAPHGQTLGGGAEIAMSAARIVAAGETYMGLVETGVGLIPAGGGCKELLRRVVSPALSVPGAPPLPFVRKVFETIAMAKVSVSAIEARELGFLSDDDLIVMNPDHLIAAAKRQVLDLTEGYQRPAGGATVYAAGNAVRAALQIGVQELQWGNFASAYDGVVAGQLARVMTGGDLSAAQWVPEQYILDLERDAFLTLLHNEKTMQRIEAMLKTGKPLRN